MIRPQRYGSLGSALACSVLIIATLPATLFSDPVIRPEALFLTREGIVTTTPLRDLIEDPHRIAMDVSGWDESGFHVIRSEYDFHTVIPAPVELVLEVITDATRASEMYKNISECRVLDAGENRFDRQVIYTEVEFRVLGFVGGYSYITNNYLERLGETSYLQKYHLVESSDDTLYQMLGNWYVEEVEIDGNTCTYVRQYTVVGIQRGSLAMELAMRTFGAANVRQVFKQLTREVGRELEAWN